MIKLRTSLENEGVEEAMLEFGRETNRKQRRKTDETTDQKQTQENTQETAQKYKQSPQPSNQARTGTYRTRDIERLTYHHDIFPSYRFEKMRKELKVGQVAGSSWTNERNPQEKKGGKGLRANSEEEKQTKNEGKETKQHNQQETQAKGKQKYTKANKTNKQTNHQSQGL